MWFISKQIKPKKPWTVSDASHFLLEKISEAHKMSPALTIYHVILIYGSQWTVRNGGGERWRAYNIYFFSELYIIGISFFCFLLYTTQAQHLFFLASWKKEVKKEKREKNLHICIILCSPSSKFPLPAICGCAALPQEHAVSSEFLCLWYHSAFALQNHEWGHYEGRQIIKILRGVGC